MATLKAEKRDLSVKAKALRRQGYVIGNLYGKQMKESIPVQIEGAEASRFLKQHTKGSQATLELDGKSINVLLKDTSFDAMRHQYTNIDFQALVANEKVTSTAPIILVNADKVEGFLTHNLSEISYKALPSSLFEKIEIDASQYKIGDNLLVSDLDVAKNQDIEILTPMDTSVLHVAEHQKHVEEETAEETEDVAEEETTEA